MTSQIPEPLQFPDDTRIDLAVEAGVSAFWDVIAQHFPEISTGDESPLASARLHQNLSDAVKAFLFSNSPYCNVDRDPTEFIEFAAVSPYFLDGQALRFLIAMHAAGHQAPYTAVFHPEANVKLGAEADRQDRHPATPLGPVSWVISSEQLRKVLNLAATPNPATGNSDVRLAIDAHSSFSDRLREDHAAPKWVRAWRGPFWVEVRDANDQFVDPWLAVPEIPA